MTALRRLLTANWPRQAGGGHFLWGPVTCNGRGVVTHNGGSKTRAKNARFDAVSGTLAGEKPRGSGGGVLVFTEGVSVSPGEGVEIRP